MATLVARDRQVPPETARQAAKEAFKAKGGDKVYLTVESGKTLQLRMGLKGDVIRFFGLLEKAERKEKEKGQ